MNQQRPNSTLIADLVAANRADLGSKLEVVATGRYAEAKRLSQLLRSRSGFSFGRIGDYDVGLLLQPDESAAYYNASHERISGTRAGGSPGLQLEQVARLRVALEWVSYLDYHELLWTDSRLLDQLGLKRAPERFRNLTRETSYILPTWLEREFKSFCRGRRILFCGAEAPLLENLLQRDAFRECARNFWPDECKAFFLRPRENGRRLGANLDLIKADLCEAIHKHQIDTLFLSLGGGAKILCCELAQELGVCAIDFGGSLRSLTYSGSDGNSATRSTHLVFLYRVPFGIYMDALVKAFSDLTTEELLAKAHAQLLLEVQKREVGWSHSAWEYDFSAENVAAFQRGFREYKRRYRYLFRHSPITVKERKDFLHFCGTHELTSEGKWFLRWFNLRGWVKNRLQ